jgi:hypothetical protein
VTSQGQKINMRVQQNLGLGFWTGGPAEYMKGLEQQSSERLKSLRAAVETAETVGDRERAAKELRDFQDSMDAKVRDIGRLLF